MQLRLVAIAVLAIVASVNCGAPAPAAPAPAPAAPAPAAGGKAAAASASAAKSSGGSGSAGVVSGAASAVEGVASEAAEGAEEVSDVFQEPSGVGELIGFAWFTIFILIIIAIIDIFCIYKIATSEHEGSKKAIWVFVVIFAPVLGVLLWFGIGADSAKYQRIPDAPESSA